MLVTTDLPSWDLQLRSDPPSYALGATTILVQRILLRAQRRGQKCSRNPICLYEIYLSDINDETGQRL